MSDSEVAAALARLEAYMAANQHWESAAAAPAVAATAAPAPVNGTAAA